ncbi:DinB family protein [Bacillus sp. DX4.1]|uniref:DinB family protein n=1 Tax=Bacillus sp. DX4.1 TaxID=3055867 RepID=UPI0025A22B44|nr:DinB family protein [Bacillus sp. DX4.1]MDM5188326.1 DinB family protein [Bacillus sp. DX4.1]
MFVRAALHQLEVSINSAIEMLKKLTDEDLQCKPIQNKRSLFEMYAHLSLICHADLLILNGATQKELDNFYLEQTPQTIDQLQQTLHQGFQLLSQTFQSYSKTELTEVMPAYWGVSYSRFEWLLEIVAHVYHHRGQIHILLVEHVADPCVSLFE